MLFDPYGEYLQLRLQGYRLERRRYQPILSAEDGTLLSRTTNLLLRPEGLRLRMVDAVTGEQLPWHDEAWTAFARVSAARQAVERKIAEEKAARQRAEERVRTLEADLGQIRKD